MCGKKLQAEDCAELLRVRAKALQEQGLTRYPCRDDFSAEEVAAIKAFLGPWPRALEKAGLKPLRDDGRAEIIRQKRILTKRKKNAQRRQELAEARQTRAIGIHDEKGKGSE